jgi:hypothetical protein
MRLTHRLDHDWQTNPPHPRQLNAWSSTHPVLDQPLDQIRADIISWDTPPSDAVVRPLLELAVAGDHDAARLLLVALAGALAKTAFRCPTQPAQGAFDDLVSQLAEVILTPYPLWTRALADQAIRMTTRQWMQRTVDVVEVLAAEAMIDDLERRFRLPDHTVTALRLAAFQGEELGASDRLDGSDARCPKATATSTRQSSSHAATVGDGVVNRVTSCLAATPNTRSVRLEHQPR